MSYNISNNMNRIGKKVTNVMVKVIGAALVTFQLSLPATLLTSCASDDEFTGTNVFGMTIQSVSLVPDGADKTIHLIEGEPSPIVYRVTPAGAAPAIASLHSDSLSLVIGRVKNRAGEASVSIASVSGTDDGLLLVTARHSGFANGKDYALALRLSDGMSAYTSLFSMVTVVEAPEVIIRIPMNMSSVSQRLAE